MVLAVFRARYRAELRADFRAYYNVSADQIGTSITVSEAMDLAAQLPAGSRCMAATNPANKWDVKDILLNNVSNTVSLLAWALTSTGKTECPKPFVLPGTDEAQKSGASKTRRSPSYTVKECQKILSQPRKEASDG